MADEVNKVGDVEKPSESSKKKPKDKTKRVNRLFWVALAILIILLILSIVILCMRIHKFSDGKTGDDEIGLNIVANSDENFDLFAIEYKNRDGELIMKSNDGKPIIGPGAKRKYMLRIKNDDDVAIDYTLKPEVEYVGDIKLPLDVQVYSADTDTYLVGKGPADFGTFDDFADIANQNYTQTLPKGEVHTYEIIWSWPLEGNDELDTEIANSPEQHGISVRMSLHNELNPAQDANGAILGLGINDMLWFLIFFILLLIAILLLVLSLITRKVEPEPAVVYVPTPVSVPTPAPVAAAPAPEPKPVVIPTPKPYKKGKGFVGKMEYVNIDTLVSNFNSGDRVTLKILKEKGLVSAKANQVKILARADIVLNKVLHIETQGISAQARQKIIAAGGTVEITEG